MGLKERLESIGESLGVDVDAIHEEAENRASAIGLERVKLAGEDHCKLCGDTVPVYKDDDWQAIFARLEEHAEERDDHVRDADGNWVIADGE